MEARLRQLEFLVDELSRKLEKYETTTEPKSGEFIGQEWYNPINEVLYKWNGKAFTPAYGQEVTQNNTIISTINNSIETSKISGAKLSLDSSTEVKTTFTLDKIHDGVNYIRITKTFNDDILQYFTTDGTNIFWKGNQLN